MLVFGFPFLDGFQSMVQLGGNRTGLTVLAYHVFLAGGTIHNLADGRDNGSRTASADFVECSQFFFFDRTAFYLQTHIGGNLLQAHIGNGTQNRIGIGRDVLVTLDGEEVGRTGFIDVLVLFGIEE